MSPPAARVVGVVLAVTALIVGIVTWTRVGLDKWGIALVLAGAGGLGVLSVLPCQVRGWIYWALYGILFCLGFVCLFGFVLPALGG